MVFSAGRGSSARHRRDGGTDFKLRGSKCSNRSRVDRLKPRDTTLLRRPQFHPGDGCVSRARTNTAGRVALGIQDDNLGGRFNAPTSWLELKPKLPRLPFSNAPVRVTWEKTEYIVGSAPVGNMGFVLVAMP